MQKQYNFIKLIRFWIVIILITIGLTVSFICISFSLNTFKSQTKRVRTNFILHQKEVIKQEVHRVVKMIYYEREHYLKIQMKKQTWSPQLNDYVKKKISKRILTKIGGIRFGGKKKNYLFIVTYDGTVLMNDTHRHLIGKNLWNLTDPNGIKVIQEERKAVKNPKGDYIYYSWNQPSTKKTLPKISFIKGVKEWKWMIGAGVYLADIDKDITLLYSNLQSRLKQKITYNITIITVIIILFLLLFNWLTRLLKKDFIQFTTFFNQATFSHEPINLKKIRFIEFNQIATNANIMQQNIISEQLRLKNSEQQLRDLFENSEVSIWNEDLSFVYQTLMELQFDDVETLKNYLHDNQEVTLRMASQIKIINVNGATLKLFQAESKNDFYHQIENTFGDNAMTVFIDELCAIWNKEKSFRSEVNFRTLHGESFEAIISFKIPEAEEGFKSIPINIIDLRELNKIEKELEFERTRLKKILDSIPDGIYIVDQQYNIQYANRALHNTFGEINNLKCYKYFHNRSNSCPWCKFPEIIAGKSVQWEWHSHIANKDYTLFDSPFTNIDGTISKFEIFHDITKQKSAEKEKQELHEQLAHRKKMDAIGQLAGGVAHDFNNMLAGIMGASDLLKMKKRNLNEKSLKLVDIIIKSAERAASLTAKLLAFGRKSKISSSPIDIHNIIDDTLSILNSTIDKQIKISSKKEATHHIVIGDTTALQNALMNLGINASHAISNSGKIEIGTKNIELNKSYCDASPFKLEPGIYVEIEVKDTGRGIPSQNIDKIFEPFFTTKKLGEGTGLGLPAVYGTIQEHHGAITVYSEVNAGTLFHMYLPCSEKDIKPNLNKTTILAGTGNILLVDDEEIIRITGKFMLEEMGYKVRLAKNGVEALKLFTEEYKKIDVVIMDMIMPEMNGRETFLKMKKIDENCKVVIASGFTKDEKLTELKKQGLLGFIQKPFRNFELSKLLADITKE